MNSPRQVRQPRERETGRYGFDGDWERVCVCGHTLGIHTAEAPHECLACDAHAIDPQRYPQRLADCDCVRFRPSKRSAPRVTRQTAAVGSCNFCDRGPGDYPVTVVESALPCGLRARLCDACVTQCAERMTARSES